MKRILLIALFVLSSSAAFCNSFTYLWGGAGLASHNNYDCGTSAGLSYYHAILGYRVGLGASVFMQQYNLYYDQQQKDADVTGATIRHNSRYVFLSPELNFHMGNKGTTHFYITAGVGFNVGVVDTMHKWAPSTVSSPGYDSMVDKSANINKMVSRVAIGLTEHFGIRKHIGVAITEDLAFLPGRLSSTTEPNNPVLNDNLNQLFKPTYFTLRIGFYYKSN